MALRRLLLASALFALALLSALTIPSARPGPAEASNALLVSTGSDHSCALLSAGTVKCWGRNNLGQLGDNSSGNQRNTPVDVCSDASCTGILSGVTYLTAGGDHTCAIASGAVVCWGDNTFGQLGNGTTGSFSDTPVSVTGLASGASNVLAGTNHTCAMISGGSAKCWGSNSDGQLGNGNPGVDSNVPVDVCASSGCPTVVSSIVGLSPGGHHTCLVVYLVAYECFGDNQYGQLGDGNSPTDSGIPVVVSGLPGPAIFLGAGDNHTCATMATTEVRCWGRNDQGQLGNNNPGVDSDVAVLVCGNTTCSSNLTGANVAGGGGAHTCAGIPLGGGNSTVKCWGDNSQGQLADGGAPNDSATPRDVCADATCTAAVSNLRAGGDLGGHHSCAPTNLGNVRCAGDNLYGQLGDGNAPTDSSTGANVTGLSSKVPVTTITSPDTAGDVGRFTQLVLNSQGNPVVSYVDTTNDDMKLLRCSDRSCSTGNVFFVPDHPNNNGGFGKGSVVLDASGNPVLGYTNTNEAKLYVVHCGNAICTAGNVVAQPAPSSVGGGVAVGPTGNVGAGYALVTGGTTLNFNALVCDNPYCTGTNTIQTAESTTDLVNVGGGSQGGVNASGFAVVSYEIAGELRVLTCGDLTCAPGGDTFATPDSAGIVGKDSALAMDAAGNPVVSYWDVTNSALKVLHCANSTCTSGSNVITTPFVAGTGTDGFSTSLRLDPSGRPTIAFWDPVQQTLAVMHCGDANCAANNTIGRPDSGGGNVGQYPSMQLDATGSPVISYYDVTNANLKIVHCADPGCAGTLTVPTSNTTGTGVAGDSPDGTAATLAQVDDPTGLSQSSTALYFADTNNCKVKKIESGISTTLAGVGSGGGPTNCGYSGDNGPATSAQLNLPRDVFLFQSDYLLIADTENCMIRMIYADVMYPIAGTAGSCGDSGDAGGTILLNKPKGVAVDASANIYIADTENCRIRKVTGGTISTIAGTTCGFSGDGGPATAAQLNKPSDLAFLLPGDDLVIADTANNRIRRYSMSTGIITTIAGTGSTTFNGDGGQATNASLSAPEALTAIDNRVLIADTQHNRIRRVNTLSGVIDTIVGVGGQTGAYALSLPQGVAVVAGGGGGGAGAAAGQGEAAGPGVTATATAFANSGLNLIGTANSPPTNDNRGTFRPTTSCSVIPRNPSSSIDFAILPVMLGLIGFRRRLRLLFITLRSMLTPKRRQAAPVLTP